MRNAELHRYRSKGWPGVGGDPAYRLLAQLCAGSLLRACGAISVPLGRVLALYLWLGRNLGALLAHSSHSVLRLAGWLSGIAFQRETTLGRWWRRHFALQLRRWHIGIALLITAGVITSATHAVRAAFDRRLARRRRYHRRMRAAADYNEWLQHATALRQAEEADAAQACGTARGGSKRGGGSAAVQASGGSSGGVCRLFDAKLLHDKTQHMARVRMSCDDVREIMFQLRIDLHRNCANIAKSKLHERNMMSVPAPIGHYLDEVKEHLIMIRDWPEAELPNSEKLAFFRETRHAFGRTALLLSGGGAYGTFHMGVCKALFEQHMLPRVLAGSSAGAIVCALVATRTDAELKELYDNIRSFDFEFFSNSRAVELLAHVVKEGSLQDVAHFVKRLRSLLGDLTFMEAYERSGRILNVTVSPADTNEPPRLLNYLTAPHALIWSAVAASSAFPGLFPAQHLLARNSKGKIVTFSAGEVGDGGQDRLWRDGSLEMDLPVQALGEMFNCNHTIVCQANPHLLPLVHIQKQLSPKWANIMEAELKHRIRVLQWLLPDWASTCGRALNLFTQPWEGDITMLVPSDTFLAVSPIINPSRSELEHLLRRGELAAWEKLAAIECNCSVEAALDACMAAVTNDARGRRATMTGIPTRVPSWLHMPAMGMPVVASWGDALALAPTGSHAASASAPRPPPADVDVPLFHSPAEPSMSAAWAKPHRGEQSSPRLGGGTVHGHAPPAATMDDSDAIRDGDGVSSAATSRGSPCGSLELPAHLFFSDGRSSSEVERPAAALPQSQPHARPQLHATRSGGGSMRVLGRGRPSRGRGRGRGRGLRPVREPSQSRLQRDELLAMATMDCTDASVDVWCALPTGAANPDGTGMHDHGIDVFAY